MTVGSIENCLTSATANPATHTHTAHFIVQNVVDLIGWQARMNYIGDEFRPNTVNFTPFVDNTTGQNISFVNLPIDQSTLVHRGVLTGINIPPSAPGPQTALVGSVYEGSQNFAISPDTPAKAVPDDTSYNAPSGGVVASISLQVVGDQSGQAGLLIDVDDNNPNAPGSTVVVFDGTGQQTIALAEGALGDGLHGEGASCDTVAGHDARLSRIGGVPKNVRLSPGEVIADSANVVVANDGNHTETIGVYVDVSHPSSGCTPNGRVLQTTVTLGAGAKTTVPVPVSYSCANPAAANGLSYSWTAVADHGGDDLSSCGAGSLQSLACFNALANDDEDTSDNRLSRTGPKVVAQ
jgi:hypothetical protein